LEHRVDPAIFDLVDMPGVWNKLQHELGQEGKKKGVNITRIYCSSTPASGPTQIHCMKQ
jgi:hypothetical protein